MDAGKVRRLAYVLLKSKFFLDNYLVHHSKEEDSMNSNPWKLQVWHRDKGSKKGQLRNLSDKKGLQDNLTQLLSMFEVSFTARQRKNYLFYCLFYLMKARKLEIEEYSTFVEGLADRYFCKVYLDGSKLNAINTPIPGSFDEVMLEGHSLSQSSFEVPNRSVFAEIYGDGREASKGVPLFIFNYLDYKLWKLYDEDLCGKDTEKGSKVLL
ncbi:MAG: hypothetical protein K5989_12430 [Lachnospiraceae bacterium]|nr:hypothetical protein [Lachnospiraceae bacterium]